MNEEQQRIEYTDACGRVRTIILPAAGMIKFGPVSVPAKDILTYMTRAGFRPRRVAEA